MNEKLSLQRLAELLPEEVFGTDAERRAAIVSGIFSLVADSLVAGENVSVKGLGTFRVTENASSPVVFEPSASFASIVNAPFAAFEPVTLADGFSDAMLEPEEEAPEAGPYPEPSPHNVPEPGPLSLPEEEPAPEPETVPVVGPVEVTLSDPDEEPMAASEAASEPDSEPETEQSPEPEPLAASESAQGVSALMAEENAPSETDASDNHFGNGFFWGLLTGLVIGAVLFLAYVVFASGAPSAEDVEPILDAETVSAATGAME